MNGRLILNPPVVLSYNSAAYSCSSPIGLFLMGFLALLFTFFIVFVLAIVLRLATAYGKCSVPDLTIFANPSAVSFPCMPACAFTW